MEFKKHFHDSFSYEIELIAKVNHEIFKRWIHEKTSGHISAEEFIIMDILDCNNNLSQIELAKATLKGKAHTGKFLDSLEKKEIITRIYDTKNSRMVKIPILTEYGRTMYRDIRIKLENEAKKIDKFYPIENIEKLKNELKEYRKKLMEIEKISF